MIELRTELVVAIARDVARATTSRLLGLVFGVGELFLLLPVLALLLFSERLGHENGL